MFLDKTELLIKLDSREIPGVHEGGDRDSGVSLHSRLQQSAAPALLPIAMVDSEVTNLDPLAPWPRHQNPDGSVWTASCEDQPLHERNRLVPALDERERSSNRQGLGQVE